MHAQPQVEDHRDAECVDDKRGKSGWEHQAFVVVVAGNVEVFEQELPAVDDLEAVERRPLPSVDRARRDRAHLVTVGDEIARKENLRLMILLKKIKSKKKKIQ